MNEKKSKYKTENSREWLENWLENVLRTNHLEYERSELQTELGKTNVLAKNSDRKDLDALIFLPGGRTCGIFWDINNNLKPLYENYRIYLIDINGQPGLSDGNAPSLDSDGYGKWLKQIVSELGLDKANFIGASFGGSLIMKLAETDSTLIKRAVMCNPAGFVNINLNPKNLFYLLMPMILPSKKNVVNFLNKIIIDENLRFDGQKLEQIADFLLYTNQNFSMQAENPKPFSDEVLRKLNAPSYLILDRDDIFINQKKTAERAAKLLPNLVETIWLEKHGHGIEFAEEIGAAIKTILESD